MDPMTLLVDAAELTAAAAPQRAVLQPVRENTAEEQPLRLEGPHPFFDGKSITYTPLFDEMPQNVDWSQPKCIKEHFPAQKKYGGRQVPMSLILDCASDKDKFLVVQWWRSRTTQEQTDEITALQQMYMRYTVSNDKV